MASNKTKFKMSIKEIVFEYEGDSEQGQQLAQGINNTLAGLANLQNRAMGIEDQRTKFIENKTPDTPLKRRRRSRSKPAANGDGVGENGDGDELDDESPEAEGGGGSPRRSSGVKPSKLLVALRKEGFFAEPREIGQVVDKLHEKGFPSIQSGHISGKLVKLVQKDVLRRNQNEQGNWLYTEGANVEPPKPQQQ